MDRQLLERLVREKEKAKVEFKATILQLRDARTGVTRSRADIRRDKIELGKDCAALANTPGGVGYLLLGVNDDGTYANPIHLNLDELYQIIATNTYPPVDVIIEDIFVAGGNRIAITVRSSRLKPHRSNLDEAVPHVPIRRGRITGWATPDEIVAMAQEGGRIHFEDLPARRGRTLATLDSVDADRLVAFVTRTRRPLISPPRDWTPTSDDGRRLIAEGLFAEEDGFLVPTARCLLVFGFRPQDFISYATVFAARYAAPDATSRLDVLSDGGGSIERQVLNVVAFLRRNIRSGFPEMVLRESLVNALIHRDYFLADQEVVVQLYPTELHITSPGTLLRLNEHDLLSGRVTANPPRRNPGLVNLLYEATLDREEARLLEREGRGFIRMRDALASAGLPPLNVHNDPDRNTFTVIFQGDFTADPFVAALDSASLSAQQRVIAEWLRSVGAARIDDLVAAGSFGTERSIRRHLDVLITAGLIIFETTPLGESLYRIRNHPG
jgi:predicted HTH transcriptional regulator